MNTLNNLDSLAGHFTPEILLMLGSVAVVLLSFRRGGGRAVFVATAGILVAALVAALLAPAGKPHAIFEGMLATDAFGRFFKILILATALVAAVLAEHTYDLKGVSKAEFSAFLLAATLGLCVMCAANDLLMMYLAIEMASVVAYVLAGYIAFNKRSEEAGLKYVFYGGMASGVMIFGLSLLYGLTGTLNLIEIRQYFLENATDRLVLFVTFIFILAGLGYKMAIAPFHMWSPDVYEGAPIAVTAFLSVASKAAGFALTARFFLVGFIEVGDAGEWLALKALDWQGLMAILAALTMTVGNLVALRQDNIKRFLAYSSVAHAGYLLMGLAVQNPNGVEGILFYFAIYFLMNLGAFLAAILVANQFGTESIADYKGLSRRGPYGFAAMMCLSVFLLSLAGIPPFAGFIAKWYVFGAVIRSGPGLLWLAVVGVLNSVVSLYYYVRIVKFMVFDEPAAQEPLAREPLALSLMMGGFAVLTLVLGIFFGPLADVARASARFLY